MISRSQLQLVRSSPKKHTSRLFPSNTQHSQLLSTSPHSEEERPSRNNQHTHFDPHESASGTATREKTIKLKIYGLSEEIGCGGDRESVEQVLERLNALQMPPFTKTCIKLVLLRKLAGQDGRFRNDLLETLQEYQRWQQNYI